MAEYSYLMLYLPRGTSRDAARRILTDHAEYGNWELSRLRLFPDGSRKATLRRLVIRQARIQLDGGPYAWAGGSRRERRSQFSRWRGEESGNAEDPGNAAGPPAS
jgi:hypothetical protein